MPGAPHWDSRGARAYTRLWEPAKTEWSCRIGNTTLPGYVEVSATVEQELDRQKPKGRDGATLRFQGRKPTEVSIRVYLAHPDDWDTWQTTTLPAIYPPIVGKEPEAYDISHPALTALALRAVAIYSVSAPQPGRVDGEKVIEIRAVEWVKPTAKAKTRTIDRAQTKGPKLRDEFSAGNFTSADNKVLTVKPANQAPKPSTQTVTPTT